MGPLSFSRLRVRLLVLILIAIIPTAGLGIYMSLRDRRGAAAEARQNTLDYVRLIAARESEEMAGIRQLLRLLALSDPVRDASPSCNALAADLRAQSLYYANVGAATRNGDIYCSAVPLRDPINADRSWFTRAVQTQRFSAGEYQIGRVTGTATQTFGYPILDGTGTLQGVAFVALDLRWFARVATDAHLPDAADLIVVDEHGTILTRYPNSTQWVGHAMSIARLADALRRGEDEGTVDGASEDGVRRVYAFVRLGQGVEPRGAYVVLGIPASVVLAGADRRLGETLAALCIVALLAFGAALEGGDRLIFRAMNALLNSTARLGAGDLTARVGPPYPKGEFGIVAHAFDEMATSLQARAAETAAAEEAVRRRVADLEALRGIARGLRQARSPVELYEKIVDQSMVLFGAAHGSLALLNADRTMFVRVCTKGIAPEITGSMFPVAGSHSGRVVESRASFVTGDFGGESEVRPVSWTNSDAYRALGPYALVPVRSEEDILGTLVVARPRGPDSPPFTEADVRLLETIAETAGTAIRRTSLHADLQRHAAGLEQRVSERTAALREAKDEADRANRAKSEFLSRMSHELRTPLNAVLGFAQLLEMDSLRPEQARRVTNIVKGGRHLLGLIDDVLDIARIEAGRLRISVEPVALHTVVQETLDLTRPLTADRQVRVACQTEADAARYVLADSQRLKQILLNLVSNAIKYGGSNAAVTLSCEDVPGGRVRIKVTDTGPGISPDKIARLFIPFERLGSEHRGIEGTGLGLALSKGLAEAMGGTLGVESTVGVGSTFWVELPAAARPLEQLQAQRLAEAGTASIDSATRTAAILYIEDNLSNFEFIKEVLNQRPQVNLLAAMQGGLGLELARRHRPDLILLDLHLPDMPGDEVLRRLQETPETRAIPVVMISADTTAGQADRLVKAGAHAYLTKPFNMTRFLALVDELLAAPEAHRGAG